jgi:hypothetical protein
VNSEERISRRDAETRRGGKNRQVAKDAKEDEEFIKNSIRVFLGALRALAV